MPFTPTCYHTASLERLRMAARLAEAGEYFAAHYFAGVAVEAILRAHAMRAGEPFSGNHSVLFWSSKAGLMPGGSEPNQDAFRATLNEVEQRWRANHRYATDKALDTYLYHMGLDRHVRGDRIKYSAKRMLDLANAIVALGDAKWK